ncbi:hypothetical protein EVA_12422 [gut metagenome]|uniref:Uncharacterized protein n=1 Tax=gut metagenome TaxID=749906 RepID=J9GCE7_9ZZZZ
MQTQTDELLFEGKLETLLCECHRVFDPLNQQFWAQAEPTAEAYPLTLSSYQRSIQEGLLMHALFRRITAPIAKQLPDFRPLHLLREMEQEALAQYLQDLGTLTDTLHYSNVGYDTLPLALEAYEKTASSLEGILKLTLVLDALPRFFYRYVDASLCEHLLDQLKFTGECYSDLSISCTGLEQLLPLFVQEMRGVLDDVINELHLEEEE